MKSTTRPAAQATLASTGRAHPLIIQGGMGIAVSGWQLAKCVARAGQLGVISGTALNAVFAERLQEGDPEGHLRRALSHFPFPSVAEEIIRQHFGVRRASGRRAVRGVPMFTFHPSDDLLKLTVAANFCEVFLAKEGHNGVVGINLLEKVQMPNLASLYGAMLAGVDYVLMGAGIPREIPHALDQLATHSVATLRLHVADAGPDDVYCIRFDPRTLFGDELPPIRRPYFLAIVSSDVLAQILVQKATSTIDGIVVENAMAGGHNAPPRGGAKLNAQGEPIYGLRDAANLEKIRALGLPFWLAGDFGTPERLAFALSEGAAGVQVGTAFAFCQESGLEPALRSRTLQLIRKGAATIFTDPKASPTGFPFKVIELSGTLAELPVYQSRPRICQLGFLRQPYKTADGSIGYRCAGEPLSKFVRKGGDPQESNGRKCLCNALMANVGLAQEQLSGYVEKPLLTAGDSISRLTTFLQYRKLEYSAQDVIRYLLSDPVPA